LLKPLDEGELEEVVKHMMVRTQRWKLALLGTLVMN
jgi:hypothetical protein